MRAVLRLSCTRALGSPFGRIRRGSMRAHGPFFDRRKADISMDAAAMAARPSSAGVTVLVSAIVAMICGLAAADAKSASINEPSVLAGSCANCHGPDGRSPGSIPTIANTSYLVLKTKLEAFKVSPPADATVMPRLMRGYDAEQIEILARYFSTITPAARP